MKVLVVTEYYPREADPVSGIWTHRQTLAARAAGADVRVLVLHRPLPPIAALHALDRKAIAATIRQPARQELDGIPVDYLRYFSPPRPWSYGSWGAWAAPALALKLRGLRREFRFELVHAHYAVPSGDAVARALARMPMVISVHGHDVYGELAGHPNVHRSLRHARLVLANSAGTARRSAKHGALKTRVVHLGSDVPDSARVPPRNPTIVTVAHLAARKRHADVLAAVALVRQRLPELRYEIVGDGPERDRLVSQAASLGISHLVNFRGKLPHGEALAVGRGASLFVMPSVNEAFGVAYIEAMAAGVPAIGCNGEDGPAEIAAAGEGMMLVAPGDVDGLARRIEELLADPDALDALGHAARETVQREFTWQRCGEQTVRAYRDLLGDAHLH